MLQARMEVELTTRTIVTWVGLSIQMSCPSPKITTAVPAISQRILKACGEVQTHLSRLQSLLQKLRQTKPQ